MAEDADQPLPGLAFFFPQSAAQITQHDQVVRKAALTKRAAAQSPTANATRKTQFHGAGRFSFDAASEAEFGCGETEKPFGRTSQEAFSGAINEFQGVRVVKGKDGNVNFFDDGAQKRRSFQGAQALFAQGLAQCVHFDHDFAEGVVAAGTASADGKIFFTHGGKQIGKSLQGKNDAMPQRNCKPEPKNNDEDGERPGSLRRIIAEPKQKDGDQGPWQARRQRQ